MILTPADQRLLALLCQLLANAEPINPKLVVFLDALIQHYQADFVVLLFEPQYSGLRGLELARSAKTQTAHLSLPELNHARRQLLHTQQLFTLDAPMSQVVMPLVLGQHSFGGIILQKQLGFAEQSFALLPILASQLVGALAYSTLAGKFQAAQAEKHQFVDIVTHELKVPLTAINGYTDMLKQGMAGDVNELQARFLTSILNNVRRMAGLISDLADISRMETGRMRIEQSRVQISTCVSDALDGLQERIAARQQKLVMEVAPDLPLVVTDYTRVVQILVNLISNAHKYTPEGGTITIRGWSDKDYLYISVTDTGIGISKQDQEKLFTQFFRSESREVRVEIGWGLGLHVTQMLVNHLDGQLHVQSELGQGSTFTVSLPLL